MRRNCKTAETHLQNQLEYAPPGLAVMIKRVIPMISSNAAIFTVKNPRNGNTINCKNKPVPTALIFFICSLKCANSTVELIPKMRKNRNILPTIGLKFAMMIFLYCICLQSVSIYAGICLL